MKKPSWLQVPSYVYGLYAVCGAGLVIAVVSFVQSWQRPVTAVSDIPKYSQTFIRETGKIIQSPAKPKYAATDMLPGDKIINFDGLSWEHAQRLNLHEIVDHTVGEHIPLVLQRGNQFVNTELVVLSSNWWEKLVLVRFALAALLGWVPSTFVLITFVREMRYQKQKKHFATERALPLDTSGVPIWVLTWQGVSIAMSMSGLKYPIAFMLANILGQVMPLFVAISSLPYPFAPRTRSIKFMQYGIGLVSLVMTYAMIHHTYPSPFPHSDWRRAVMVPNTIHDTPIQWTNYFVIAGITLTIVGTFMAAFSSQAVAFLQNLTNNKHVPFKPFWQKTAQWIEQAYHDRPPALAEIAMFQLMIIAVYLVLDILPRSLFGTGCGYSVLLSVVPLSFLLLHSDLQARIYGRRLISGMTMVVFGLQVPFAIYRLSNNTFGQGCDLIDLATILTITFGSIIGGMVITFEQRTRKRLYKLQEAIDDLFIMETRETFWYHLTEKVGFHLGVRTWFWLTRETGQAWRVEEQTEYTSSEWLQSSTIQDFLLSQTISVPIEKISGATSMPVTLLFVPVYRDEAREDLLVAVNPSSLQKGLELKENPSIYGRLMQAMHALRKGEYQQQIIQQEQTLREKEQRLTKGYQQLYRRERSQTQTSQAQLGALLHDKALQWLVDLKRTLNTVSSSPVLPDEQASLLKTSVASCSAINEEIRRVLQELRPRGFGQTLPELFEYIVSSWQQQNQVVRFRLQVDEVIPDFSESQRNVIYLIVNQSVENALKHGAATKIVITTHADTQLSQFVIVIQDNGKGFVYDKEKVVPTSLGLLLMQDLAGEIGGEVNIDTQPGSGCRVILSLMV